MKKRIPSFLLGIHNHMSNWLIRTNQLFFLALGPIHNLHLLYLHKKYLDYGHNLRKVQAAMRKHSTTKW